MLKGYNVGFGPKPAWDHIHHQDFLIVPFIHSIEEFHQHVQGGPNSTLLHLDE